MNETPSPSKPANINVSLAPNLAQLVSKHLTNPNSVFHLESHLSPMYLNPHLRAQEPDICVCGCQYGGCVPQRRYENPRNDLVSEYERGALITFSVNGKCGFSVRNALDKRYAGLDGRDDHMFVGFKSAVAVRFEVSVALGSCDLNVND